MLELCSPRRTPQDWGSSQAGAGAWHWWLLFLAPEHMSNLIKWSPPFPLPPLPVLPSLPCSPVLQLSLTAGSPIRGWAVVGRHVGCLCRTYPAAQRVHSVSLTLHCSKADFAPSSSRLSHPIFQMS